MAFVHHVKWCSGMVAFPILLGQALQTRRRTPVLPSAPPPHSGTFVPSQPSSRNELFSLYLVGESTVAGVGARDHVHGLAGRLAHELGNALCRPVRWEALGLAGVQARECLRGLIEVELAPRLESAPADLVVVVLGVNDTTKLTSRSNWREAIGDIIARLRHQTECPIAFTGIPPMHQFPALPWPLRSVIGARARMLDADLRRLTDSADNCHYHSIDVALEGNDLAADGFHPSETGYARWAEDLSRHLMPELRAPTHE